MTRHDSSKLFRERDRMTAAMKRLEELLRDPGPGITVVPVTDASSRFRSTQPAEIKGRTARPPRPKREAAVKVPDAPGKTADTVVPPPKCEPEVAAKVPQALEEKNVKAELPRRDQIKTFVVKTPPAGGIFGSMLAVFLGPGEGPMKAAIAKSRRALSAMCLFSMVMNVLMLAGPLFMLQVYDRVLASGSIPTLVALALMTAALYAIVGCLDLIRSRIIVRVGVELDGRVGDPLFQASLRRGLASHGAATSTLRELDTFRQFIAGPGPITFFDAPWTPIYLFVIFAVHWTLGIAAALGAAVLLLIAWMSEQRSRAPLIEAGKAAARSLELADTGQRNAEAITAMGMLSAYRGRWQAANAEALSWQTLAADRLGGLGALSKTLRLLMQSLMLAIGAALAINGEISAGSIIAATIIFGRALAPVEQAVGHWRGFIRARESYRSLEDLLMQEPPRKNRTALPPPKGRLEVANLRVAAPGTGNIILNTLSFAVAPGELLAVIGPSASGKSTLARTLVGLWAPSSGSVRLDGARLDQWHAEDLGRHIGYLPQNVELFAGTVKDNIARFRSDAQDEEIVEAAQRAHAHEMILALPQGYETELGAFGTYLSAGQRQRIALARALFGNPALVVLDEPNSNLDRNGDEALASAIDGMRARGQAVVLVSHRVQAIGKCDLLLYLDRGVQRAFGPRHEVMKLFQAGPAPAAAARMPPQDVAAVAVGSDAA